MSKKEQKSRSGRKTLLLLLCMVIVAGVGITATLAYLTAQTAQKDNKFTASGGIDGEVEEPNYPGDDNGDVTYYPGEPTPKDPLIHNLTGDESIYVGARIDFYVKDAAGTYHLVTYDKFDDYVTLDGFPTGTWSSSVTEATTGAGDWYEMTSTKGNTSSKYYIFSKKLAPKVTDDVSKTYTANGDADYSKPLFTKATVNKELTISKTGTKNAYDDFISKNVTTNLFKDASGSYVLYKGFDFKIIVTGYGVMYDATDSSANTLAAVQPTILTGLDVAASATL